MGLIRFMKRIPQRIAAAGGLSSLAGGAIGWLGMGLRILGIVSPEVRAKVAPLEQSVMGLIALESRHHDATFWSLTELASQANMVTLVIDGEPHDFKASAEYGAQFKRRWFDRYFKRPLIELRSVFDIDNDGVIDWLELPENVGDPDDEADD